MSPGAEDGELLVSLEQLLVVQGESIADPYDDNYIRYHHGPIWLVDGETEKRTEIGEIELYYIDGTRAPTRRGRLSRPRALRRHR
jgi:hypothetical protein